jgi:FkbM family methyltransferase
MEKYIEKLLEIVNFDDGFYIECGANDGVTQSYSYELEQKNWKGILVEPSINAFNKCVINRSDKNIFINCALVSNDDTDNILGDFDGNLMSSVNGERLASNSKLKEVSSRTITSILDEYKIKNIDLFSLDVEGYELEVLKGLDFAVYSPTYLLIEIYSKDYDNIINFLKIQNYEIMLSTTNFNLSDNPHWDGTHNDYLFKKI